MGGVRAVMLREARRSLARTLRSGLALTVLATVACQSGSAGQDAGRRDPELERRVEDLLPSVEELAGINAAHVPQVRRSDTATLERYLLERLEAGYPGDTLENVGLAYKAFGLLPDTVDLKTLLVDLLLEQTVGYYDPVRDAFFIREDVGRATLEPVLVHELVHALQDQQVDLDSLLHATDRNDGRSAMQSAMEGHATIVMMGYMAGQVTGTAVRIEQLPEIGPEMRGLLADPTTMPRLTEAPAIIRETLLFAYLGGARYVQRLWRSRPGRPAPLGAWLPESTEQLLHTERILDERDRPTVITIGAPPKGWQLRYASDLGELETKIYFEEHLGVGQVADDAAKGWDGDAYALLTRGDEIALVWYTIWDSATDAEEFTTAYERAFRARHGLEDGSPLVGRDVRATVHSLSLQGMPSVRVVETPADAELTPPDAEIGSDGAR